MATNATYINAERPSPPPLPALLATSRQVRHEALPIYFGQNRFRAELVVRNGDHFDRLHSPKLWEWLHAIGKESASKIRHFELEFSIHATRIARIHADICRLADAVPWALGTPDSAHRMSWDFLVVERALGLAELGVSDDVVVITTF